MAKMVKDFWNGKKVFLTGHTGFKGSWMALWLHEMGAQVTGYSLAPQTNPSLYEILKIDKIIDSHFGDINDYEKLNSVIRKAQPEIVIHMAAQALVRYSYDHPVETYRTNVMGTVHVLEACRMNKSVKAVLNVTSDKCYENVEKSQGYEEHEPMGGYDPYSNSKGCAELVTSAYRRSFYNKAEIGLASARAGNVIGGGDWSSDRLLPDIFRAFYKNEAVEIRNPKAVRPWQHVLEPINGYLTLAKKLYENPQQYAEGFNFGPNEKDAQSVEYVLDKTMKVWGEGARVNFAKNYSGPHEAKLLKLNISKAKKTLNWEPRWNLDMAIEKTVSWYKTYLNAPENIFDMTRLQIQEYEKET